MPFAHIKDVINESYDEGKIWYSTFRKIPAIASVGGNWVDLSMAAGNPKPNYYATAELTSEVKDYKYGIYHGGNVFPDTKHLHKICMYSSIAGAAPATYILCDWLLYYPLIDMDSTDEQSLINSISLPRYRDGLGVKAFLVASNPYVGGAGFNINYTNSDGVSGRTSQYMTSNLSTFIATIVNSGTALAAYRGPFIDLAPGDRGIRSVESITFLAPNGGLGVLVLAKPIVTMMTREITAWSEFDFLKDKPSLPRIYDGAYLNFLCHGSATIAAAPIIGEATFIWG